MKFKSSAKKFGDSKIKIRLFLLAEQNMYYLCQAHRKIKYFIVKNFFPHNLEQNY